MVLVQMYVTATTQTIDLQLSPANYRIHLVGANSLYAANEATRFTLSLQSTFTMQKFGNVRYLQFGNPMSHWYQIDGKKCWDAYYYGPFELRLIDVSTGVAPSANRFQEATIYFDVEKID